MVSIIIPFYNEKPEVLFSCIASLVKQSYTDFEIILVDDGSTNLNNETFQNLDLFIKNKKIIIIHQDHLGAGAARNLGAEKARGDILVFVDADMEFDTEFLKDLIDPILRKDIWGTFSKEEYLKNKENSWAIFWNVNRYKINGWKLDSEVYNRILPTYYPDTQNVFRAIKKSVFMKVDGFDETGYTDDWSLSEKLLKQATFTQGAKFYHRNPESPQEVWNQARWVGKNKFISGTILRKIYNLLRYSLIVSLFNGIMIARKIKSLQYIVFKIIYDFAVTFSIIENFFSKKLYK
jgi:glycosyltransferase involved in cell wall biosynthesis